jgi:SAM-dependent methyltransferase
MKRQTDDPNYAARMQAVYDRSDEKAILKRKLAQVLQGGRFGDALDVGPGPGEVTQVLHDHAERLSLIEITPTYESALRKRFPQAQLTIDSIDNVKLARKYDVILFSHALYYQPEDRWFQVCSRLHEALRPEGTLILVMNVDRGAYWELVQSCWKQDPDLKTFHLKAWSQFLRELAPLGKLESHSVMYAPEFSEAEFDDYIGRGLLAVPDRAVYERNRAFIHEFCQRYRKPDGRYRMEIGCDLLTVQKS